MSSGTYEAIVYDTLLDGVGDAALLERMIGRLRAVESAALVVGRAVRRAPRRGGPVACHVYVRTVPFVALAALALLRFRELRGHTDAAVALPLRRQIATTYRALVDRRGIRSIVALLVQKRAAAADDARARRCGSSRSPPAGTVRPAVGGAIALGLGGLLRRPCRAARGVPTAIIGASVVGCGVVLAISRDTATVVGAQVLLVLLVVAVSIPLTTRLHDAVPLIVRRRRVWRWHVVVVDVPPVRADLRRGQQELGRRP